MRVWPDQASDLERRDPGPAMERDTVQMRGIGHSLESHVLELEHISKRFGPVVALDDTDLQVRTGEVHALLGENGAGKTTLMNIACGVIRADAGHICIGGRQVAVRSPRDASRFGVGIVHQQFRLVENLTVAQNIHVGWRERSLLVSDEMLRRRTAELSARFSFDLDPGARVSQLPAGQQQRVAILRALARGARVLVLDEPTSVLTPHDASRLFDVIRSMSSAGQTVVLISHKLDEVMHVADRVSVLRHGRRVATLPIADCDHRSLARLMVGHQLQPLVHRPARPGPDALVASEISVADERGRATLRSVDLSVRAGEIVGVAGVSGNGQRELAEVITGMRPPSTGTVWVGGDLTGASAREFIHAGVGHIPEDPRTGVVMSAPVDSNAVMKNADRPPVRRFLLVSPAQIRTLASRVLAAAGLRHVSGARRTGTLSGGQIQRVLVHRELLAGTRLLVVVNGTAGLDIAAAQEVRANLLKARDDDVGLLLISEDLDELLELSDRLIVMLGGRIVAEFARSDFDREQIGLLMGGVVDSHASGGAFSSGRSGSGDD